MPDRKGQLSRASESLLRRLADLRATDERKREMPISSPEFHRLAEQVTEKSRDLMRTAGDEEAIGDETERSSETIDDVDARRAAERRRTPGGA